MRHRIRPFVFFPMRTRTIMELGLIGLVLRAFSSGKRSSVPVKNPQVGEGAKALIVVALTLLGGCFASLFAVMIFAKLLAINTQPRMSVPVQILNKPSDPLALYRGNDRPIAAKNSIVVNQQKIDGIDMLVPERRGNVTIIHTGGGVDVPANKLPQAFLNAWGVTPEVLRDRDLAPAK